MSLPAITADHIEMVAKQAFLVRRKYGLPTRLVSVLISAGHLGLMEARERYDSSGGTFDSFAWHKVRFAMLDELRFERGTKRRHEEASKRGLPDLTAAPALERWRCVETFPSAARSPDELAQDARDAAAVREALRALPERARLLVLGVYFEGRTAEAVGAGMGITKGWASRILTSARETMRASLTPAGDA